MINTSQGHLRNSVGSNFDRVDAFLRTNSSMCFKPMNLEFHAIGGRGPGKQKSHRIAVQYQSGTGAKLAYVQTSGADQPGFLTKRETHNHIAPGQARFLDYA